MKSWIVLATLVGILSMGCAHRQAEQGSSASPGGSQTGGGSESPQYQPLNPSSSPPSGQMTPKAGPSPSDLAPEQSPGDSGPEFMVPRKSQETFSI